MVLGYVSTFDPLDTTNWSGTVFNIYNALSNSGFQTIPIGNLKTKYNRITSTKERLYRRLLSKTYRAEREPWVCKSYAHQVKERLASVKCDAVVSPGTLPIAYLRTEKPQFFWADATFAGIIGFYQGFSNLCAETIRNGNKIEQLALSKCRLAIYASEWAANSALQNYDVDPAKIKVVPFGANIVCNRTVKDIDLITEKKTFDICKLLFVGVEWIRKGGDVAFKVANLLNQRGIRTELHVVGCNPPEGLPGFVVNHGFLSKKSEEEMSLFNKLMSESHFLILPSFAECFGVVFAEASSFGLPSLATRVGGIPTAIRDGKNGQTFPLNENPEIYCDYIQRFMSSRQAYNELALSSFAEYAERLNWSSAGKKVFDLIRESCG